MLSWSDSSLANMFIALYNFVFNYHFVIDGFTFTLFDVLEAGVFFSVVSLAIKEIVGHFIVINEW